MHEQLAPTHRTIDVFKILRHSDTTKKLAAILILLVLLPAIFYSAYEITSLTQSEAMVGEIYRQQLDALLFSVNQYAWDIANSWVNDINGMIRGQLHSALAPSQAQFQDFIIRNKGIEALFVSDTSGTSVSMACFAPRDSSHSRSREADFVTLVHVQGQLVSRLLHLQRTGYRKIEGVPITTSRSNSSTCLLFAVQGSQDRLVIAGIVLDAEEFIRDVLRGKLDEAGGNEFILSVLRKPDLQQVYATAQLAQGMERQTKDLWLFPDYVLGIRSRGQTIEELVKDRFYRNLALLVILDLMIIAGVWFVYRTLRREMELARLKSDFVSNVSHELRTPLSLIRMFGETLEMGRVSSEEKKKEYYSTIVRESERLTGLVNNVLNFSRMESGKKEFHFVEVELNPIVRRVIDQYEPHMKHLGFAVQIALADTLPPIRADEVAIAEALLNIVDNAMKYSAGEKFIRIATGESGDSIFVEVEDHGIGIAASEQVKIFGKFYRTSSGLAHHTRGSGLGLTLVEHIMGAHHGSVSVKSQMGTGSTFRLSFPRTI